MSKRFKFSNLIIGKKNYETLLRWSLGLKEIGGLCFGKGNEITFAVRLTNLTDSRNYYSWCKTERKNLIEEFEKKGLKLIAEFHSHCHTQHLKWPSPLDVKYFQSGLPHLICFPHEATVRCWLMTKSYKKTKESKLNLKIKSR